MSFSRANPSARYRELLELNKQMHEQGEIQSGLTPEETFKGLSLYPQLKRIKSLIERTGAKTLLDYGSGKGHLYQLRPIQIKGSSYASLNDYWGVSQVYCYDPGFAPYSLLPEGRFDGVIATDTLEHCPEEDLPWIIEEIFDYAKLFVFASIALYPATKYLANGENTHCTVKPKEWWEGLLQRASARRPEIICKVCYESLKASKQQQ